MNSMKDHGETVIDDEEEDGVIPGTIFNERQARILKVAVIVMGVMLVIGFAVLIGLIAYRASQPKTPPEPIAPAGVQVPQAALPQAPPTTISTPRALTASIPKGAKHISSTVNGNRLIITLQTPQDGLQLMLFDLHNWRLIGTAKLTPEN
jgi:hypothetical protein